jgi:hypothetical protein
VWWLQTNLSITPNYKNDDPILKTIQQKFNNEAVTHYAFQDPGIRWIKTKFLKLEDYASRLDVYRFTGFVIN